MQIVRAFLTVFAFIAISAQVFSQTPEIEWSRTFGGSDWDECHYVRQTSDGGFILGGRTVSWGNGNGDFLLIKTDAEGDQEWMRTYGGAMYERSRCARQTDDGGFIIAGCTGSWGAGDLDAWAVKTSNLGDTLWTMLYGGSSEDRLTGVRETRDKGYIFTGFTYSHAPYDRNAMAIKTNGAGEVEWTEIYGGVDDDFFLDVYETHEGEFVFVGTTKSYGEGDFDFYLVQTDSVGNELWYETYGGSGGDLCFNILPTNDNTYMLLGPTGSYGAGDRDNWLMEIQPNGQVVRSQTYGGYSYEWGCVVERTPDDGFVMFGETMSFGSGDRDFWIVKTDRVGGMEWQLPIGGFDLEITWCGQPTFDDGYIVAGYTATYGAGSTDVWLVKLGASGPECTPQTISVRPSEIDFGVVDLGESCSRFLSISNPDTCDAFVTNVYVAEPFFVDFHGPYTIEPGNSVAVEVYFAPEAAEEYTQTLWVYSNALNSPVQVPVSGIGGAAMLVAEPSDLEFGEVLVGTPESRTLRLANIGTIGLTVNSVYVPPAFETDFEGPYLLTAGAEIFVEVTFTPDSAKLYEDILVVTSDLEPPTTVVGLTGTGVPLGTDTDNGGLVTSFDLKDVYPNPFNPSTTISFDVPTPSDVRIDVYDITGRKTAELVNGVFSAGRHQLNWSCPECAAGMYLVTMTSGNYRAVSKALFVK